MKKKMIATLFFLVMGVQFFGCNGTRPVAPVGAYVPTPPATIVSILTATSTPALVPTLTPTPIVPLPTLTPII
jgi:hypothetical protein